MMKISAHARETLVLGLPLAGSSLAQMSLHLVNTIMVGWYGVIPLAALVLGATTYFTIFVMGSGFARAVMPLAANARAKGDETELRRSARMGLWLSIAFGLIAYPLFWFSEPLLMTLGQKPEVAHEAQNYLRLAGLGMLPALAINVLQGWLAALGRTQVALAITVGAVALNFGLNWLFIFGHWGAPELGVTGAGLSVLIVQLISVALLAAYAAYLPSLRAYALFRRFWKLDSAAMWQVFRLGVPIGLTGLAESALFSASALMMGWIGAVELAAHGIALEAAALTFMLHVGISNAATIRVASFAGVADAQGLRDAAKVAIGLSMAVSVVVITAFLTLPEVIVGVFLDSNRPDSAEILAFGTQLLALAALFQLADAAQVMALGLLRGIQDTRVPMWLAAISYWLIGIPVSYVLAFPLGYGGVGLWFGLVIGLLDAGVSLMIRFWLLAPKPGWARETAL